MNATITREILIHPIQQLKELKEMSNNTSTSTNMPDNFNNTSHTQQIPRLNQTQHISNYFNQESNIPNTSGYLEESKSIRNISILSLNPHGYSPFNSSKMHMLQQAIERLQLDIMLMNKVNTKWTSINISKIEQEIYRIDRAPTIITADSNQWETTPKDYLPGGIMNIILSRYHPILNNKQITKGRLGNWTAFPL